MTDIDFGSFDLTKMEVANNDAVEPGKHKAIITEVEATVSKRSGAPMLVVTWMVDDDNDTSAGRTVREWVVLFFNNRKTGKQQLGFQVPRYFAAAGQWSAKVSERNKLLAPSAINKTFDKVIAGLVGKTATITTKLDEPRPRLDEMGSPIYDENGEQLFWDANASITRVDFDAVKRTDKDKIDL